MRDFANAHPSEESVELYARGKLTGAAFEQFEEHLLVCEHCQDQVAEADEYVAAMKAAAGKLQKERPFASTAGARWVWYGWLAKPVWVGALAAAILAIAIWAPRGRPETYDSEVTLLAMRGIESVASSVPAGKPFRLKVDVTDVPVVSTYKLEIASSAGAVVWQASVRRQGVTLAANVAKRLSAGRYWVRLSDGDGALLREYGLESR